MNRLYSLLLVAVLASLVGCASADKNLYKATGTVVTLVDKSMAAWADYVVWTRTQPGIDQAKVADQWVEVGVTYENYQAVLNTVYTLRSMGQPINQQELTDAAMQVFNLINQFLPANRKVTAQ